jgi:hypothetical protein
VIHHPDARLDLHSDAADYEAALIVLSADNAMSKTLP